MSSCFLWACWTFYSLFPWQQRTEVLQACQTLFLLVYKRCLLVFAEVILVSLSLQLSEGLWQHLRITPMQQLLPYFNNHDLPKIPLLYFLETSAPSWNWLDWFMWSPLGSSCQIRHAVMLRTLKRSSVCFSFFLGFGTQKNLYSVWDHLALKGVHPSVLRLRLKEPLTRFSCAKMAAFDKRGTCALVRRRRKLRAGEFLVSAKKKDEKKVW